MLFLLETVFQLMKIRIFLLWLAMINLLRTYVDFTCIYIYSFRCDDKFWIFFSMINIRNRYSSLYDISYTKCAVKKKNKQYYFPSLSFYGITHIQYTSKIIKDFIYNWSNLGGFSQISSESKWFKEL